MAGVKKLYAIYVEGTEKVNEIKDKLNELKDTIENTLSKPLVKQFSLEEQEEEKVLVRNRKQMIRKLDNYIKK